MLEDDCNAGLVVRRNILERWYELEAKATELRDWCELDFIAVTD